jgi:polyhydroxybutyrate depolymerase
MYPPLVERAPLRLRSRHVAASVFLAILMHGAGADVSLPPGDHSFTVQHQGLARSYLVRVPPLALAGKPLPVVINFHGGGGNARTQKWYSRMDATADRMGFVVVYPNGSGGIGERFHTWNAGNCCGWAALYGIDDVGFTLAALDDLARRTAVDHARVYATGLSNGAMMAYRLAAEASERIAAAAGVAGAMTLAGFAPRLPVPVLHIHSVDDERARYDGGLGPAFPLTDTRVFHASVTDMLTKWLRHNGCPGERVAAPPIAGTGADTGHSATRFTWGPCRAGSEVMLLRLTGAGHVWPGGRRDFLPALLGTSTGVIDANAEIWAFFARFRRATH